ALAVGLVAPAPAQEKPWWPFPVEDRDPPFNMEGKKLKKDYIPIDHAAKKWNMCVSFPHMKDAYWIAVDYGVVSESRRLGVKMQLVEAGGYTNLAKQVSQIEDCVAQGANAVIIGAISARGVVAGNKCFTDSVARGAIEVVSTKYGDTGKEIQLKLVEDVLQAYPNIDYIVGTSPTTEAAAQALRDAGKSDKIKVLAYYFTPGVYQDIKRGAVLAAPTDSAVIQGRIAIDQAVRILENKPYTKHTGPAIYVIDKSNIK